MQHRRTQRGFENAAKGAGCFQREVKYKENVALLRAVVCGSAGQRTRHKRVHTRMRTQH